MLAKIWKKLLLAICIIACLFNITSKLVNRHSLKDNLENANDGTTVFDIFKKDSIEVQESDVIDGVMSQSTNDSTEVTNSSVVENNSVVENTQNNEIVEDDSNLEVQDESKTENKKSYNYSDFIIRF